MFECVYVIVLSVVLLDLLGFWDCECCFCEVVIHIVDSGFWLAFLVDLAGPH